MTTWGAYLPCGLIPRLSACPRCFIHYQVSGGSLQDARGDLEQGALAGALAADDAEDLALLDLKADIAQGPELAAFAVAVVFLPDLEQRVGPPARLGLPAVQVFAQGAAADEAEAVVFAEVFDLDDGAHEGQVSGFWVLGSGGRCQ